MKKLITLGLLTLTVILSASNTVYITPKGKKYHSSRECRTIKRSKSVQEVNIKNVGGRKACGVC
ncbi:MAG: hypothetical protein ACRC0S_07975 [Fusobacteriaceae bacterium]